MTHKERLEMSHITKVVKREIVIAKSLGKTDTVNLPIDIVMSLIEMGEQVGGQQKEIDELKDKIFAHIRMGFNVNSENARLREALEFYADEYNWHDENVGGPYQPVYESGASRDGGEKARQALKGDK